MTPNKRAWTLLLRALCALGLGGSPADNALAASFDCARKLNQVETLICEDPELSRQDEGLAAAYAMAFKQGTAAQRESLLREQRQWIAQRNSGCALSDIDNEANRSAARRCIASSTSSRVDALKAIAAGAAPGAAVAKHSGEQYHRGANDVLQLTEQADGKAALAIMAGNARGVCDVELDGRRVAASRFLFTDADSGCSVSVDLAGNTATVDSSGACSSFCGEHAPGFTGAYLRAVAPRPVVKDR
jgi:uncharacterized protein YecT (DUF1311 family)